jgi:hypothetical protein
MTIAAAMLSVASASRARNSVKDSFLNASGKRLYHIRPRFYEIAAQAAIACSVFHLSYAAILTPLGAQAAAL